MEMNDAAAELQVIIQQQQAFVNEYTEMKEAEKRRIEEEKRSVVNDNKHFEIEIEEKQRKIDALELEIKYSTERFNIKFRLI